MVLQGVAYLEAKAAEEGVIATGSGLLCVRGVLCVYRSRRRRVWCFVRGGGVACVFFLVRAAAHRPLCAGGW